MPAATAGLPVFVGDGFDPYIRCEVFPDTSQSLRLFYFRQICQMAHFSIYLLMMQEFSAILVMIKHRKQKTGIMQSKLIPTKDRRLT